MHAETVTCRIGRVVRHGRTITIERAVDPATVAEAVRADGPVELRESTLAIDAPAPGPLHEHVGCIHPDMGLRTRTALARAGRTKGMSTPHDEAVDEARERLVDLPSPREDERTHRRDVATTDADTADLVEQVATMRGRLAERRDGDGETEPTREQLVDAITDLSEIETARIAARERFDRERADRRTRREQLDRRRELQDRIANLERKARAHLVETLREPFAAAVDSVPRTGSGTAATDPFETEPVTAALAIGRVGELSAPVVLGCERFDSPAEAREWLGVPVVNV